MSGPSFGFKWNQVNPDIDWQLTQSKSYGDSIASIGNAVNALADANRKQNTDELLLQIAQANNSGDLGATGILDGLNVGDRTVSNMEVLNAFNARNNTLRNQETSNLLNDMIMDNVTSEADILQRISDAGIAPEYQGPLVQHVQGLRTKAADAARQARADKIEEAKAASQIALNNSTIETNRTNNAKTVHTTPGLRVEKYVPGEDGRLKLVIEEGPSLADTLTPKERTGLPAPNVGGRSVKLTPEQQTNMDTAWKALKTAGVSDAAAAYLMAEFGREGSFLDANIYGNHSDPKAKRTNSGIISWSDPARRKGFMEYMSRNGHIDANGNMKKSPQALSDQVSYMLQEMRTSYPQAFEALQRGDLTDAEADKLFGGSYIGWSRNDPAFSATGYQNRTDFLNATISRYGGNSALDSAVTGNTGASGAAASASPKGNAPASKPKATVTNADGSVAPSSAAKGASLPAGVGFESKSVYDAQQAMMQHLESENTANVIKNAQPTAADTTDYQNFLKDEGYLGNEIFSRKAEVFGTLKRYDFFNKMPPGEKKEFLQYVDKRNQGGFWLSGRMSADELKNTINQYTSDKKKDRIASERQKRFEALQTAATKLYQANVNKYPNITMQMAREMVDAKLAKEYEQLRKPS